MNQEVLSQVVAYLKEHKCVLDQEIVHYTTLFAKKDRKPAPYTFTAKQFDELVRALDKEHSGEECENYHELPGGRDCRMYFEHEGVKFTLRLLIGQGSCFQLVHEDAMPTKIKFLKRRAIKL